MTASLLTWTSQTSGRHYRLTPVLNTRNATGTSHPATYTCSCRHIPNTLRARLYGQSRVLQHERCGNNTNSCYRNTCGVVGSGKNRTTWGRLVTFRPIRSSSTSNERNTFNLAYGLHPRGQASRHSACSACRYGAGTLRRGFGPGSCRFGRTVRVGRCRSSTGDRRRVRFSAVASHRPFDAPTVHRP